MKDINNTNVKNRLQSPLGFRATNETWILPCEMGNKPKITLALETKHSQALLEELRVDRIELFLQNVFLM